MRCGFEGKRESSSFSSSSSTLFYYTRSFSTPSPPAATRRRSRSSQHLRLPVLLVDPRHAPRRQHRGQQLRPAVGQPAPVPGQDLGRPGLGVARRAGGCRLPPLFRRRVLAVLVLVLGFLLPVSASARPLLPPAATSSEVSVGPPPPPSFFLSMISRVLHLVRTSRENSSRSSSRLKAEDLFDDLPPPSPPPLPPPGLSAPARSRFDSTRCSIFSSMEPAAMRR